MVRSTSVLPGNLNSNDSASFVVHRETSGVVRSYPDEDLAARLSAVTVTCPTDEADLTRPTSARTDLVDLYAVDQDASLDKLYRTLPLSSVTLALRFSSADDLREQLAATLKPNQAIRQLEVLGHGSPYHIGPIDTCSVAAFAEAVSPYLSSAGTVYLSGCNTGVASDPPNIAQALADTRLASAVYGARGFLYGGTYLAGTVRSSDISPVGSTSESVPTLKLTGATSGGPGVDAFKRYAADPKGGPCYVCLDTTDDGKTLGQLGFSASWRRALVTHVLSRGWGSAPVAPHDDENVLRLKPDLVFSASGDVYELYCADGPRSVLRRKSDRREVQFNAPAAQQAALSGILRPFAFEGQP